MLGRNCNTTANATDSSGWRRIYNGDIEHSKSNLYPYVAGDDGRWALSQQLAEDIIGRILP